MEEASVSEKARRDRQLIGLAAEARAKAYAPYSNYAVGAALLTASGRLFTGCNVENASYGLTLCAERVAAVRAVSEGERDFVAIAVVTENGVAPCGACRQVLAEFGPNMRVLISDAEGQYRACWLSDLLPEHFGPSHLPRRSAPR